MVILDVVIVYIRCSYSLYMVILDVVIVYIRCSYSLFMVIFMLYVLVILDVSHNCIYPHLSVNRSNVELHTNFVVMVQRMMVCMGQGLIPYVTRIIHALLIHTSYETVTRSMACISHLLKAFYTPLQDQINQVFLTIIRRLNEYIQLAEEADKGVVLKDMHFFLSQLISRGMSGVLYAAPNLSALPDILGL